MTEKQHCFRVTYRTWVNDGLTNAVHLSTVAATHRRAAENVTRHILEVNDLLRVDIEICDVKWIEEIDC